MLTKSILTATAIALVATVGSALAGDEFNTPERSFVEPVSAFATLNGMTTEPLPASELSVIRGGESIYTRIFVVGFLNLKPEQIPGGSPIMVIDAPDGL